MSIDRRSAMRQALTVASAAGAGVLVCQKADAAPVPKDFFKEPHTFTLQTGWRWCKKCEGLFLASNSNGSCPAGKEHDASDSGYYAVQVASVAGQGDWRRCKKCESLFFGADKRRGSCPAGKEHDASDTSYILSHKA